ncbi:MAG: hypothetical protein ACOX6P_11405 [Candidatus Merdivicinus sp.]|jgi:hypothetical protein
MEKVIEKIREQGKGYKAHSNEWNVMNQLIDLVAADPVAADLVDKDLDVPEMSVKKLVSEITGKRMADPIEVMKAICKFYGLAVPDELPPEYWRTEKKTAPQPAAKKTVVSFMDLLGGEGN